MKRKALMMLREDPTLTDLGRAVTLRRDAASKRLKELREEMEAVVNESQAADLVALKLVEERILKLGVHIFDRANHEISCHFDEGVVWLEQKSECTCPACRGMGVVIVGLPPQ